MNRQDLRTNSHFRDFLELDTQIPESVVNTPIKVAELPDLNLGGRDFLLLRQEGLLFIAQSDMNVASRLDSYLTNVCHLYHWHHCFSLTSHGKRVVLQPIFQPLWVHWSSIRLPLPRMTSGGLRECGPKPSRVRPTSFIGVQIWRLCSWAWTMEPFINFSFRRNTTTYQEVSDSLWIMIISTDRMKPCIHIQSE